MIHASLKYAAYTRASHDVLGHVLGIAAYDRRERGTDGFLARLRLWLILIWDGICGQEICVQAGPDIPYSSCNRHDTRVLRRNLPMGRLISPLAFHILRVRGRKAFLQWQYNRSLFSRAARCEFGTHWRWTHRIVTALSLLAHDGPMRRKAVAAGENCAAPLRPD